jgi:anti-sigma factor RsiW
VAESDDLTLEDLEQFASGELDVRAQSRIQLLIERDPKCKQAWEEYSERERLAQELRDVGALRLDDDPSTS